MEMLACLDAKASRKPGPTHHSEEDTEERENEKVVSYRERTEYKDEPQSRFVPVIAY
jgi:hypothetical protein